MNDRIKKIILNLPQPTKVVFFSLPVILLFLVLISAFLWKAPQQFTLLAQAFVHGHLNFGHSIGGEGFDPIIYKGRIYWGEGPFPGILLMPFVLLGYLFNFFFYQGYISWLLIIGILFFVFKLARRFGYNSSDSFLLGLTFVVGSAFVGVALIASSGFYAQVLTVFLLFWGLYEYLVKEHPRWWLLGIISGLLAITRITAAPIIIFFLLELYVKSKKEPSRRYARLIQLSLPFVIAICLIAIYNWLRFGSPFNGGFAYQVLFPSSAAARALGLFSPVHIPTNLYSLFLRSPLPITRTSDSWTLKFPYIKNNVYGMSIFFTSPYLLYLFHEKWSAYSSQLKRLLITSVISLLGVASYYGDGLQQYGYRYSLDFLPEIFLIFMVIYAKRHKTISTGMKALMLATIIINFSLAFYSGL